MAEVRWTVDFDRIAGLPRRSLSERAAVARARVLTTEYRLPGGGMSLLPWQGFALWEAADHDGALLVLPVGFGKTLISFLAPTVMGATRPILIVPAALREKTFADFASYLPHWRPWAYPMRTLSREELAPERGATLLEQIAPDLIVIDECDELANPKSSAVRRITRYLHAHPTTRVVAMTGTLGRKSIMNYWHILLWTHGNRAPVPLTRGEAETWAMALDEGRGQAWRYTNPGPLGGDVDTARAWYARRLAETPGVVIVDGDSCDAPLTVRVRCAKEDPVLNDVFERFLKTLETPCGEPVTGSLSRWRFDGELGLGLYSKWNPAPPEEWLDARRAVAKFVRDRIAETTHARKPLDSEGQVLRRHEDHPIVKRWRSVEDMFDPEAHRETVWLATSTIESVRAWLAESAAPAIVWCGNVEFGERCAATCRLPYYGPEGKTRGGASLLQANPRASLFASWQANKRGFNLQPWRRHLLVMPPQSAKYLEQVFGRSHRQGQTEHVTIDVLATSGGTFDAFDAAVAEAGFGKETVGTTQKILRAKIEREAPTVTKANKYRWARKNADKRRAASPILTGVRRHPNGIVTSTYRIA